MWIAGIDHSRELDRRSMEEYGIPSVVLMERAGQAVFDAVREVIPECGSLAVVCGKGGNGGDGFVAARLAQQAGFQVLCIVAAKEQELCPDAKREMTRAMSQGVHPIYCDNPQWCDRLDSLSHFDMVIDALLGTGVKTHVRGPVLDAIEAINRSGTPVVAVDIPSGVDADTGEELGESVWALRTVVMGQPKPYLFQGIGLEHTGLWTVADIGYPRELMREETDARLMEESWVADLMPVRQRAAHKGVNGHLLIVAGSHQMRGAAVLAAEAALRSGVGLVTVAGIESVCEAVITRCPEALLLPLPEVDGVIAPSAAEVIKNSSRSYSAALFGPGMTHSPAILDLLGSLWSWWETPSCIDADALNATSLGVPLPQTDCILTPHPGEMSRLLKVSTAEVQCDRFKSVRLAVEKFDQTVLLKGPHSIVGSPAEPASVNRTGNPGMAAGGMGDVLGGMIGTLMAQDLPSYFAGCVGMYWHGMAADKCAEETAPIGYTARDVAAAIPRARAKLAESCCDNC